MTADQEHEMTGRDWADEFLPIPADRHDMNRHPVNPGVDLIKAQRIERTLIAVGSSLLSAVALGVVALYMFGVAP